MSDLLEMLTLEDLRESNLELARIVGIEGFKALVREYGGTSKLYIPKADMVVIPVRDTLIRREYNGSNTFSLSRKWGLSDRFIQEIVKDENKRIRTAPIENQISFF